MIGKDILNKTATIEEQRLIIVEEIQTTYGIQELEEKISNIKRNKERLLQEHEYLVAEYAKLVSEEEEFKTHLTNLQNLAVDEGLELIR